MSLTALLENGAGLSVRADRSDLSHAELVARSDRLRDSLWGIGVRPGDRVGLRLHKSLDAVVAIFGVLKTGAAYVPVDAESPAARGAFILNDCEVKAVITERAIRDVLAGELAKLGASPAFLIPDELPAAPAVPTVFSKPDDIAYILYTSGSTGRPKGVVLTHGNALSFLDWCSATFQPTAKDVFSSHAPFHFDLSILDVYLPIKHGARLVLIGEELGKDPLRLAAAIAEEKITNWYSTPSILSMLRNYGKLERYDYSSLHTVLFAGEVFPVPQFRAVKEIWSHPRYYNLYGPTETNVCTWYQVPGDDSWMARDTFPIGRICEPNTGRVVDERDIDVERGSEGELVVAGPNVMQGYWNLPEQNAKAFLVDSTGRRWYRTGDVVTEGENGEYTYRGRRDRMVKRRGYRVELGEIEAALMRHPDIRETAVVSVADPEAGVRIAAFVSCQAGKSLSIIALKTHSSQNLPPYMIPDRFKVVDALPRTSTDKVDLQNLKSRLESGTGAA
jgi:L-proline---[L-prolyl-carrier protein] ligase